MNVAIWLFIAIAVIVGVVSVIAQALNKIKEAEAPPRRMPARRTDRGDEPRRPEKDMDRFLAEIDRLRRKNAEKNEPDAARPRPPKALPVARQSSRGEKPKPKVVAEIIEPQRRRVDTSAMAAPPAPVAPGTLSPDGHTNPDELPVATVVGATSATGAPSATRVTKLPTRARPTPRTNLAMNLTGLLNSGQGVAMAIILQEILGPPKSKK
ncbi:MAG TPA: hypothetical protein VGL71_10345 [Urbifossiella sp.]|jgi:hypothetical protein